MWIPSFSHIPPSAQEPEEYHRNVPWGFKGKGKGGGGGGKGETSGLRQAKSAGEGENSHRSIRKREVSKQQVGMYTLSICACAVVMMILH